MKVCTDGCLFGAWVAAKIEKRDPTVECILDIGAGTGLLSLMLAQKTKAKIQAVEIDESAAQQAAGNFEGSQFARQLELHQTDIRDFKPDFKYDLVVSNPPFFQNDLKSANQKRNIALHAESLSFEELITSTDRLLDEAGFFAVLLPYHCTTSFVQLTNDKGLYPAEKVLVKQTERHPYFRSILLLSRTEAEVKTSEIIIKNEGHYSKEFSSLLKDYYLFL